MKSKLFLIVVSLVSTACTHLQTPANNTASNTELVLASELNWGPLNAARGKNSPRAATLWGDRNGVGATGFLVQFAEGFSSPPHIHNVSYRGVVMNGLVHNDDPAAAKMWMPAGSFWTQPKGEDHITAAKDHFNLAYIEIDSGPYLVLPSEKAFANQEQPVNVSSSNIVWLDSRDVTWIDKTASSGIEQSAKMAFLWGTPEANQLNGTLLKLPKGFDGKIQSHEAIFRAVVIQGQLSYQAMQSDVNTLQAGSYFGSSSASTHHITCEQTDECLVYIRTTGPYDVHAH